MAARYQIRPAMLEDTPVLPFIERSAASLFEECLQETGLTAEALERVNSVENFEQALHAGRLWVAVSLNGDPVGFALARELGGMAHLDELDVLPAHGRQGLGSQLLRTVCHWARAAGYHAVTLSTFRDVPWNAPFYLRHGFRIVDPGSLSGEHVDLVRLEQARGLRTDLRVVMEYRMENP